MGGMGGMGPDVHRDPCRRSDEQRENPGAPEPMPPTQPIVQLHRSTRRSRTHRLPVRVELIDRFVYRPLRYAGQIEPGERKADFRYFR